MSRTIVKIGVDDFTALRAHLFRDDNDEPAAILLCGPASSSRRETFLVREIHYVADEDFSNGIHGYRQIVPQVIAELSGRANETALSWLSIHSHPLAYDKNALSRDDLAAHQRLFPHLFDIVGRPVGGLALGQASIAGEVWFSREGNTAAVEELQIVGPTRSVLRPRSLHDEQDVGERFDRQARLFGAAGQRILQSLRVGVVGLGGGGSMIAEQLAHLGVGELTLVDFDTVKQINLNRIVGARDTDADLGVKKIDVSRRMIAAVSPSSRVTTIDGDIADEVVVEQLCDLDFIYLATDTMTSRLVFDVLLHRYLIPGVQIGAKVELLPNTEHEPEVYVAIRPIFPSSGCLHCNGLISAQRLQEEARTDEEQVAQNYLNMPEVIDPSVISLNGSAASWAVTAMLFWATGLAETGLTAHRLIFARSGDVHAVTDHRDLDCLICGRTARSHYAGGDPISALPIRAAAGQR